MSKIKVLDNVLPPKICTFITHLLFNRNSWTIARDKPSDQDNIDEFFNRKEPNDAGFFIKTREEYRDVQVNGQIDYQLNTFAIVAVGVIEHQLQLQNLSIQRIFWNYYTRVSKGVFHTDRSKEEGEKLGKETTSILLNLNDNNGYTEFETGEKFYSKAGQALVFPSTIPHVGVGPSDVNYRFNINICIDHN